MEYIYYLTIGINLTGIALTVYAIEKHNKNVRLHSKQLTEEWRKLGAAQREWQIFQQLHQQGITPVEKRDFTLN